MRFVLSGILALFLVVNGASADQNPQGNGTVLDSRSGLLWQQNENSRMSWEAAVDRCDRLNLDNRADWRLPTREELRTLVDTDRRDPAIDTSLFPRARTTAYWTSSREQERIWGIGFSDGEEYLFGGNELALYARCVTDARPEPPASSPSIASVSPTIQIESFLQEWAAAWSRQDLDRYLSFYSDRFSPGGLNRQEWQIQRRRALSRPEWIKVQLENLEFPQPEGLRIEVIFDQSYHSDIFRDKVRKRVRLERQNETWRIVQEETLAVLD